MDYKFERPRANKIPRDKMIAELERVAAHFNYTRFTWKEFREHGNISPDTVNVEFGGLVKALNFLEKWLKSKNIVLKKRSRNKFSDKELFDEMARIWNQKGHRPSISEWEESNPKISWYTYLKYFNGWENACLRFIEYKMGGKILLGDDISQKASMESFLAKPNSVAYNEDSSRVIPLGVRIKVLYRDSFKCVFCGRSPATDAGVKLHIDHKTPFSVGGKSTIDNLQTLCQDCNLGKSNRIINSNV